MGSFNNWEAANLGSSAQNEKFRRLMGIKNPSQGGKGIFGFQARNDQKIFRDLEEGFERARQTHFPHSIDKTWDLFSEALKSPATEAEVKMEVTAPTSDEVVETKVKEKKKKKKNKDVESSEESSENTKKIAEKVPEESSEKENVGAKPKKKKKDKKLAEQESEGTLKRKRDENMEVEEEEEAS